MWMARADGRLCDAAHLRVLAVKRVLSATAADPIHHAVKLAALKDGTGAKAVVEDASTALSGTEGGREVVIETWADIWRLLDNEMDRLKGEGAFHTEWSPRVSCCTLSSSGFGARLGHKAGVERLAQVFEAE
mmetsp:Transcript_37526/g.99888  ORF Transcript_37526/g.99888 Transcript_37526/m.99888 type:complete len:132 (+) Transcript_37526:234-629(+)